MSKKRFAKELTKNDTGESGAHQAGIHIPKRASELVDFLPPLDASTKNPDIWISFTDATGVDWRFRYIYYNNRYHDIGGTRDEYRITNMTQYLRSSNARAGDTLVISRVDARSSYQIEVIPRSRVEDQAQFDPGPNRIRLKGWRRIH